MQKADAGSLIGVVSSTILSALSFIYNLGVLQLLFPYLAGAFTTYFVQHRLQMETEKREIERKNYELMRERIYGPTLKYVNILINNLVRIEKYFNIDKNKIIKEVLSDHLFFACNKQFRDNSLTL